MATYYYQPIRFRGTKFYYNPYHRIRDRYADLERKVTEGFYERSIFMDCAKNYAPHNWFYDDARKFPKLVFGEDVIQEHWNTRFPNKNAHVFSFISRDRDFYTHPRDLWVETQVKLMKEKRLNYSEGYKAMEREYQKQLYVSQLERQHQLQQVQELGGCTELSDRTWLDQWMVDEVTARSKAAEESINREYKRLLVNVIEQRENDFEMKRNSENEKSKPTKNEDGEDVDSADESEKAKTEIAAAKDAESDLELDSDADFKGLQNLYYGTGNTPADARSVEEIEREKELLEKQVKNDKDDDEELDENQILQANFFIENTPNIVLNSLYDIEDIGNEITDDSDPISDVSDFDIEKEFKNPNITKEDIEKQKQKIANIKKRIQDMDEGKDIKLPESDEDISESITIDPEIQSIFDQDSKRIHKYIKYAQENEDANFDDFIDSNESEGEHLDSISDTEAELSRELGDKSNLGINEEEMPSLEDLPEKISILDFHPSGVDPKRVIKFIRDHPEVEEKFDSTWLLDKDFMFELYSYDRETFWKLYNLAKDNEERHHVLSNFFTNKYWEEFSREKSREEKEKLNSMVIPGHPNQFPRFLWEEETREMRKKDKEFADLLASTGNQDAHKWYNSRKEKEGRAKDNINSLVSQMKAKIAENKSSDKE